MSSLTDLLLRIVVDPNYQTKGSTLTWEELDANFKLIGDVIRELNTIDPGGIAPYDPETEYTLGNYASYQNNLWEYIYPTPSTGNAPALNSPYWAIRSAGALAHQQNTDTHTTSFSFGVGSDGSCKIYARGLEVPGQEPSLVFLPGEVGQEGRNFWKFTNNGTDFFPIGLEYTPENAANKDTENGYVGLSAWSIKFRNLAGSFTSLLQNAATAVRTYTFPDKDITVAGLDDVALKKNIANDAPTVVNTAGTMTINGVVGSLLTLDCGNREESKFKFVGNTSPLSIDLTNFPEGAYAMLTIERSTNVNMSIRFRNKTYLLSNTQLINNGKDALIVRGRSAGRTVAYLGFYCAAEQGAENNEDPAVVTNIVSIVKFTEDTQL